MSQYFIDSIYVSSTMIIFVYVLLSFTLFFLFNLFDVRFVKTLSDFKKFGLMFPTNLFFLVTIMSFAGIPPLFGFSIKLMLFLILINSTAIFYSVLLAIFNFFTLYFYIQNVRYIVNNSSSNYYLYINHFAHVSESLFFLLIIMFLINLGGVIYLSDFIIFFSNFTI